MKYAWVRNSDDTILKIQDYPEDWDKNSIKHKFGPDYAVRIIPYEVDENLTFNHDTEIQEANQSILLTKVRMIKSIRKLTTEELGEKSDNVDRNSKKDSIAGKVSVLRQWADTAENVTVTQGNAIPTLQGVVDNLAQFYDAFADLIEGRRFDK